MHISCGEIGGFDESVLIHIDVRFIAVGAYFFAVGRGFNIPGRFGVLCVFAVFVGASALRLDHAGIDDANAPMSDQQPFLLELRVDLFE